MNNLNSLVKKKKKLENNLKAKEEEKNRLEDKLEDQRKIKNNIIQKQREIKTTSRILKTPLVPQSLLAPAETIVKFFAKMVIIGVPTLLFTYGPLANLLHTTKIINTIISIIIFTSLTFTAQIIEAKRYKKNIRKKLIKAFQTDNIEDINKKLDNELEETTKHQRILNQKKYRLENEIVYLQKEIKNNKEKMYNQVVPTSTKEADKNVQQAQIESKAKTLKRTGGVNQ